MSPELFGLSSFQTDLFLLVDDLFLEKGHHSFFFAVIVDNITNSFVLILVRVVLLMSSLRHLLEHLLVQLLIFSVGL